jgi:HEAT repeat protein
MAQARNRYPQALFRRYKIERQVVRALASGDVLSVRALLLNGDEDERFVAASHLWPLIRDFQGPDREALGAELLRAARDDRSRDVRSQALLGLEWVDTEESRQVLLSALGDPDLVWFASVSLGHLREARAVPRLIEYLSEQIGDDVAGNLVGGALLDIGTPEALEFLREHPKVLPSEMRGQLNQRG